jgi:hypothetical protein
MKEGRTFASNGARERDEMRAGRGMPDERARQVHDRDLADVLGPKGVTSGAFVIVRP